LGGGLMWLDSTCQDRYDKVFLDCTTQQQREILDLIAYRKNAVTDESLSQGVEFFCVPAQLYLGRFLHQQDWHRISWLCREYIFA
jgi:hypothetical protein